MRKIVIALVVLMLSVASFAGKAKSEVIKKSERFISYQGLIENLDDIELDGTKNYKVIFRLYNETGKVVWSENQDLTIDNGIINANLGSNVNFESKIFNNKLYLTLEINGEETEKQLLTGSPYSMIAKRVSEDAIVGGSGISVKKNKDGKLEISNLFLSNNGKDNKGGNEFQADGQISSNNTNGGAIRIVGPDNLVQLGIGNTSNDRNAFIQSRHRSNTYPTAWGTLNLQPLGGKVGIGTKRPVSTLDVNGQVNLKADGQISSSNTNGGAIRIKGLNNLLQIGTGNTNNDRNAYIQSRHSSNTYPTAWGTLSLQPFGGDIRIGSTTSTNNLRINGTVYAKEVQVKTNVFPDYVFTDNYNLKSLNEVDNFIKTNGHLPGMPSAQEVIQNGMNLKEIQLKLVEKVEELTLHMIELKKENEKLKRQVNQ